MSEPDLYAFLAIQVAVTALVTDRIYPLRIPQHHFDQAAGMPCVVFQRTGATRDSVFGEPNTSNQGLVNADYQLDLYSPRYDDLAPLARALRLSLVNYVGPMGEARISAILLANDFDTTAESDPGLFRRTMLFTIWYLED